jgi:hypothetical protein
MKDSNLSKEKGLANACEKDLGWRCQEQGRQRDSRSKYRLLYDFTFGVTEIAFKVRRH